MGLSYIIKRKLEKQQMERKKAMEKQNLENSNTQDITTNITNEMVNSFNESKPLEETINPQIEEKMEKALDEEVNKTKEVYMKLRSEDFWTSKTSLMQNENLPNVQVEENKEEISTNFTLPTSEKNFFEDSLKQFSEDKFLQTQTAPIEIKREKICAPVGAKPWKTSRKNN